MQKVLFLIISHLILFSSSSIACQRFPYNLPICAEFTKHEAVFLGKVIKIEDLTGKGDYYDNTLKVEFKIQENFKGAEKETLTLITPDWRGACGLEVKKGQTWLVYASYDNEDKVFESIDGKKYNSKSDREEIEILRNSSKKKSLGEISGQFISFMNYYQYEPAEIILEGEGIRQTANSDENGKYRFSNLRAGLYKIEIRFPFYASFLTVYEKSNVFIKEQEIPSIYRYEVELKESDCDFFGNEIIKHLNGKNKQI